MVDIAAVESIKVRWIIGIYYAAFLAVIGYVIYDITVNHRWAGFTASSSYRSSWIVGDRAWNGPRSERWCLNKSFDWPLPASQFMYEGPHNLTNVSCAWMDNTDMASFITDTSVGLPTFYEVNDAAAGIPTPYFTTALDAWTVNFNHGFQHPSTGSVSLPTTIIYDVHGKEYMRVQSTNLLTLTYKDIMKIVDQDLDSKTPTLPQLGVADSTLRHTGLYILMDFQYSNYDAGVAEERRLCRVTFTLVENVWGVLATRDRVEYHGLLIRVSQSGTAGSFSYYSFGVYIINTVVLLGIADFVARSAYGLQQALQKKLDGDKEVEEGAKDDDEASDVVVVNVREAKGDAYLRSACTTD